MGDPEVAQYLGVTEADVMAVDHRRRPQGQEDRRTVPHHQGRAGRVPRLVCGSARRRIASDRRSSARSAESGRQCRPHVSIRLPTPARRHRAGQARAPTAAARWNGTPPSSCSPARSADSSPRTSRRCTRPPASGPAIHEHRPGACPGRGRRRAAAATAAPTVKVKCQSCHAISVFEPGRVAQRCDFCGSPSIVPVRRNARRRSRPRACCPCGSAKAQVRDILKQWYASRWFAPTASSRRPSPTRCTRSTCRTGRSTPRSRRLDRRVGRLLLRDRVRPPTPRATASAAAGAARSAGIRRRATRSLLRRRPRPRHGRRAHRPAPRGRAVPDRSARALRPGLRPRLDRRALPGRSAQGLGHVAAADGRSRSTRCAPAGARRHAPQPARRPRATPAERSSTSSCPSGW